MLTSEQAIVAFEGGKAVPDRLTRGRHGHYVALAGRMLAIYQRGIGRQRSQLHRQVESLFADEPDCEVRRIRAFCKLLDDKSIYNRDMRGAASKLRLRVFAAAARFHPLVIQADRLFEHGATEVKAGIAQEIGQPWEQIEQQLYADVMAFQRLEAFEGYPDAAALLSRYNVAQVQACLYRALSMVVEATDDFKIILRYAKLARLLHEIERVGPSRYRIGFSGPASILRETRGYGVQMARFLPALLACRGWKMEAAIRTPWKTRAMLLLKEGDGLTSHLPPPEDFDSDIEETFAKKFGDQHEGWQLIREGEILHVHQKTFVPDFTFRHEDGTQVLLEIVGFWTPEYLAKKRETLQLFRGQRILLAVPEKSLREGVTPGENVITYKSVLKVERVMEALERVRNNMAG